MARNSSAAPATLNLFNPLRGWSPNLRLVASALILDIALRLVLVSLKQSTSVYPVLVGRGLGLVLARTMKLIGSVCFLAEALARPRSDSSLAGCLYTGIPAG